MENFREETKQAIRALSAVAGIWQIRLDNGWQPPTDSPFPWVQVRRSLAALVPGMRDASEWAARVDMSAVPPRNVVMILAGNTPLLGWSPLCACLLAGVEAIHVKLSRDEKIWMPLFAESLRTIDAKLAGRIYLHDFPGEDERTTALLQNANAVIAYGSDAAIAALQTKTPSGVPFFGYGHAISIGILCADAGPDTASGFTEDILMYDQQGCLSPQVILTEASGESAMAFATKHLSGALAKTADGLAVLPVTDPAIAHEIREARDMALFSGYEVLGDDALRWTIAYSAEPLPTPAPVMHGFIYIQPLPDNTPLSLATQLRPVLGIVSSAGVAGTLPAGWHSALHLLGVSRICSPGMMQTPPLDWNNGGKDLLVELLRSTHQS